MTQSSDNLPEEDDHLKLTGEGLFPLLPLRNTVVFPYMIVSLHVGRQKSIRALEEVMSTNKTLMLSAQEDSELEDPETKDIKTIGTIANVLQLLKMPDGGVKVLVEGICRAEIKKFLDTEDMFRVQATVLSEKQTDTVRTQALARSVVNTFGDYVRLNKKIPADVAIAIKEYDDTSKLADTVASHLKVKAMQKQSLLEKTVVAERLNAILDIMENEISVLQAEKKIRTRVKRQMEKSQRDYYLNEQIKAIQKELGEEDGQNDFQEIEKKIEKTKFTKEAREKILGELKKLKQMSPMSAEATVVRNYIDWLLSIPWSTRTRIKKDLKQAQNVLEQDHFGLDKVKERIVEQLAVQNRTNKLKGPILCLVGPPGVGKTSLGKSIARATGREFVRVALGGVRDEAEIRGHRRTYIGSMPGRIIQSMKKASSTNPLFLLDEIDKLGVDFRGDPSSALLEVLDPEQNVAFNDHYLEVDYNLSNVMFVTTANTLNIPPALLDRMEIIRIAGYTEEEKVEIAKRHLLPRKTKDHGLKAGEMIINDDALVEIVRRYTRESGVRNLEREISKIARKAVTKLMKDGKLKKITVTPDNIEEFLGVPKYRFGQIETADQIGGVTGLAWTEVGGELLTIEAVSMPGKGKMTVTGKLGDVMKESISAAASFVRSRSREFGVMNKMFESHDIHVHVPEGAIPKDGPSAGIGMATAIISLLTGIAVRKEVAMTGEVTLRGRVLPIGGLKEKLLAALRGGIKKVLIPEENAKDLAEIPEIVTKSMEIIPVSSMDDVLKHALVTMPVPIEEVKEDAEKPSDVITAAKTKEKSDDSIVSH